MGNCGYTKSGITTCEIVGIILSIVAGVAVGVLYSLGLIPVAINLIRIALVMSVITLAILIASLFAANFMKGYNPFYRCICTFGKYTLAGVIGTFLATTIAAIAGVIIPTIVSTIFVGLSAFFFVLMIVAVICLVSCLINQTCRENTEC